MVAIMRTVLLVGFPDCCALDLVGPSDVFATADQLAGDALYECRIGGLRAGEAIRTESGLRLITDVAIGEAAPAVHTLLVGGGNGFRRACQDRDLIAAIADAAPRADRFGSVCNGTFLLAEAGLLSGHRVTTHWAVAAELAAAYPDIDVAADAIYVGSPPVFTSAGVTAGIDLALSLVAEDHGDDLARSVARRMVVHRHRRGGQSQFSERLEPADRLRPGIRKALTAFEDHPGADHSVTAMAARADMSPRNFARAFRAETGTTPGRWVERARVDLARRVLEADDGPRSSTDVAHAAGFASPHTLRQAFVRVTGMSPAQFGRSVRPRP